MGGEISRAGKKEARKPSSLQDIGTGVSDMLVSASVEALCDFPYFPGQCPLLRGGKACTETCLGRRTDCRLLEGGRNGLAKAARPPANRPSFQTDQPVVGMGSGSAGGYGIR